MQQLNPETHTCPDCGYVWKHGEHGGHSCAVMLKAKVAEMEEEAAYATHWCRIASEGQATLRSRVAELEASGTALLSALHERWSGRLVDRLVRDRATALGETINCK